jgi:hypothetical protein
VSAPRPRPAHGPAAAVAAPPRLGGWLLLALEATTYAVLLTFVVALSTTPLIAPVSLLGPADAAPGVHRISAGDRELAVFVTPQRPGRNLILLPGGNGAVGTHPDRLTPATSRPGTSGSWALVELPEGTARLWVQQDGVLAELTVHTEGGAALDVHGPDGPECASAQLGRALAGAPALDHCPADRLLATDGAALRAAVGFIAGRGNRALTLVADQSARSAAAAEAVRAAAAAESVAVHAPGAGSGPVVVVAGWEEAASTLYDIAAGRSAAEGIYLAPWLLSAPLLEVPAGQLLVLPFSPADALPRRYVEALGAALAGADPTASGYASWLAAQGIKGSEGASGIRLYAPATVNADLFANAGGGRHDHGRPAVSTDWLPGGRLTAVTGGLG